MEDNKMLDELKKINENLEIIQSIMIQINNQRYFEPLINPIIRKGSIND